MESVTEKAGDEFDTMVNARKGKVTGVKKGKGASNRGRSSGSSSARESATDGGRDDTDVLMDTEDDGVDEETRLMEEELEGLRERLRSRRGSMSGTRENQEQRDRDRSARDRRTDGGTERRVVLERSRSPSVRSRQWSRQEKEEELAAMRRQVERLASKVTQMERGKKWKHKGNEKQFQFAAEVRGIVV